MKKLTSTRGIPLPTLFFITDSSEIAGIPKGVPYFLGQPGTEEDVVALLEHEALYEIAKNTGYPFNFKKLLKEQGFYDLSKSETADDVSTNIANPSKKDSESIRESLIDMRSYLSNSSKFVDVNLIKNLKIFPIWLDDVEAAISVNLNNYAMFDSNMYNKKLDGMYGGMRLLDPAKNLIIIDISSSIPMEVSKTTLLLAKNMSHSFYADVMITGTRTTVYPFEQVSSLDVRTIYRQNGRSNERANFMKLVTGDERVYDTVIAFGDCDSPAHEWSDDGHEFIKDERGQNEFNKWKINNLISFHTSEEWYRDNIRGTEEEKLENVPLAGYSRWFKPKKITKIKGWIKDLDRG